MGGKDIVIWMTNGEKVLYKKNIDVPAEDIHIDPAL